jgi:hypothetical protein
MKYTDEELFDIYNSIMLDSISETNPELAIYRNALNCIYWDHIMMFDAISPNVIHDIERRYKYSREFMRRIFEMLYRVPVDQIDNIDNNFLDTVDFHDCPNLTTLNILDAIVTPKEIEESSTECYISFAAMYFERVIREIIVMEVKLNNLDSFMEAVYKGLNGKLEIWDENRSLVSILLAYLYAHQDEYDLDSISKIVCDYMDNIEYYQDLFQLEEGHSSGEMVYTYDIEKVQFYHRLHDAIENNKRIVLR